MVKRAAFIFLAVAFFLSGCATVPAKYVALAPFCEGKGIKCDYDTFTRAMTLSHDAHKISLMAGQNMVLVDGAAQYLKEPVELREGVLVVPYKFKEDVLDKWAASAPRPVLKIKKVVIDPGHGGNDPGTIGASGVREKHVNLDIAKRIAALLKEQGVEVILTRDKDEFIALSRRAEIANNAKADLFISVHANANRVRSLNGLEVYYISPYIDDSARAFNTAQDVAPDPEGAYFAPASNPQDLKAIVWDLIYTYNRALSVELAQSICKSADRDLDTKIIGVKNANFQVLRNTRMPAVLIEVGFLSNVKEERLLKNNYYRQKIAENITEGIINYAGEVVL